MPTATEEDVWDLVQNLNFSRDKEEVVAEIALNLGPGKLKCLRGKVTELENELRDEALDHEDKPDWVSEDGMAESAGAVVAKGRIRYYEVLNNPSLFWAEEYEDHGNPILSSYLPFRKDYAKFTDAHYRHRGERWAEEYKEIAENEKYAEDYREKARVLYGMLDEGVSALAGRSKYNSYLDDDTDYDTDLMIRYAEALEDDVEPRHVKRLVRDFELFREGYYDA